jgi:hypothetical protein
MARRIRRFIVGLLILVIGGTACSVGQKEIINNFSEETGMTKQESQQYIENIPEDELISFYELSEDHITAGQEVFKIVTELDCDNYQYEWETETLSCIKGLSQLTTFGVRNLDLGEIYKVLGTGYAFTKTYEEAIALIDLLNESLSSEILVAILGEKSIEEMITTNLYNKAILQTEVEERSK